jgi:hypothetical protein
MMNKQTNSDNEKKLVTIITIILIALIIISAIYLILPEISSKNKYNNQEYTSSITYISPEEAYNLINTNTNLNIIDVRNCKCSYDDERLTYTTIYINYLNAEEYYNSSYDLTHDILVYDNYGNNSKLNESTHFCNKLIGKIYGKIYYLEGGIIAWIKKEYQTFIPPNIK